MDSLSEDVLAYFRVTLSQKFEPEKRAHLLVSTPVDVEFEMLVLACSINLLNDFFSKRFKSTLEEDLELIKNPQLAYNVRLAIMNRIDLKRILNSNVKIFRYAAVELVLDDCVPTALAVFPRFITISILIDDTRLLFVAMQ